MAQPLLRAEIDVDAPPARVWELVSDLSNMPRWSPQCRYTKVFGPLRAGARMLNLNRRGPLFWPTSSRVVEVVDQRRVAFRVNENNTVWSYDLTPEGTGTRVVASRNAENGVKAISTTLINALLGGVPNFEVELVDGMNQSLARIKAAAEG